MWHCPTWLVFRATIHSAITSTILLLLSLYIKVFILCIFLPLEWLLQLCSSSYVVVVIFVAVVFVYFVAFWAENPTTQEFSSNFTLHTVSIGWHGCCFLGSIRMVNRTKIDAWAWVMFSQRTYSQHFWNLSYFRFARKKNIKPIDTNTHTSISTMAGEQKVAKKKKDFPKNYFNIQGGVRRRYAIVHAWRECSLYRMSFDSDSARTSETFSIFPLSRV